MSDKNDVFGVKLEVGDTVAFTVPYYKATLVVGVVVKFALKKMLVEWVDKERRNIIRETYKWPSEVVKKTQAACIN